MSSAAAFDATAFLLAGGQGTRLRPAVADRPKPLAPVRGRPFAEWLVHSLAGQGIRRIVFCTGHMADQIASHFGDGRAWGVETVYSREEKPLGTAGALRLATERMPGEAPLLALNADSYCDFDVVRLVSTHRTRGARGTVWLARADDAGRYGSVEADADGRVTAFAEKSSRHGRGWINAGIYALDRDVLAGIPAGAAASLETQVLPALAGKGLWSVAGESPLLDIGTPESYARAEAFLEGMRSR